MLWKLLLVTLPGLCAAVAFAQEPTVSPSDQNPPQESSPTPSESSPNASPTVRPTIYLQGWFPATFESDLGNAVYVHPEHGSRLIVYVDSKTTFWEGRAPGTRTALTPGRRLVIHYASQNDLLLGEQIIMIDDDDDPHAYARPNKKKKAK